MGLTMGCTDVAVQAFDGRYKHDEDFKRTLISYHCVWFRYCIGNTCGRLFDVVSIDAQTAGEIKRFSDLRPCDTVDFFTVRCKFRRAVIIGRMNPTSLAHLNYDLDQHYTLVTEAGTLHGCSFTSGVFPAQKNWTRISCSGYSAIFWHSGRDYIESLIAFHSLYVSCLLRRRREDLRYIAEQILQQGYRFTPRIYYVVCDMLLYINVDDGISITYELSHTLDILDQIVDFFNITDWFALRGDVYADNWLDLEAQCSELEEEQYYS
jgi:hypothetical protein